ncbi:hypothetical protein L3V82_11350 [Thiotrichales bacterium 19S3-7]|nr:hypothetical protein [Thiotrichales bacterium 19S3-7]MCF6802809.1 hypothetical protein [Thiotrichales bacterium 19S3-11]
MPNSNSYSIGNVNHWVVPNINHGNAPTGRTFGQSYYGQGRSVPIFGVKINSENLKIADKKYIFEKRINFPWETNRNSFTEAEYLRLNERNKVQMHHLHAIFDDTRGFYQQFYSQKKLDDYDYFDSLQKSLLNTTLTNINNDPLLAKQQQYFAARILNFYEDNYQETSGQLSDNVKLLFFKEAKLIDKDATAIPAEIDANVKQYQENARYLDQIYNASLTIQDEAPVNNSIMNLLVSESLSKDEINDIKHYIINDEIGIFQKYNSIKTILELLENAEKKVSYENDINETKVFKILAELKLDANSNNNLSHADRVFLFTNNLTELLSMTTSAKSIELIDSEIKNAFENIDHPFRFLCEEKQFIGGSTYTSDAKPYQTALRLIGIRKAEIQSFDTLSNPELYNNPASSIDDKKALFLSKLKTYLSDSHLNKTDLNHLHSFIYSTIENEAHPLRFICQKTGVVANAFGQDFGETSTLNNAISMIESKKSEVNTNLVHTPNSLFYSPNTTKTNPKSLTDHSLFTK